MKTSQAETTFRQLTVRLPRALHTRARQLAKARHTSLNALVRLLLEELDRNERERSLEAAYNSLGRGRGTDVEHFFDAAAEVIRRG